MQCLILKSAQNEARLLFVGGEHGVLSARCFIHCLREMYGETLLCVCSCVCCRVQGWEANGETVVCGVTKGCGKEIPFSSFIRSVQSSGVFWGWQSLVFGIGFRLKNWSDTKTLTSEPAWPLKFCTLPDQ